MGRQTRGILLASGGAILWGIAGPVAQLLFDDYGVNLDWLIGSKMLIAGVILLILGSFWPAQRRQILGIWRSRRSIMQLLIFTIFGMTAMQYVYYKAVAVGNAATATILQFLSPIFIVLYIAFRYRTQPRRPDVIAIIAALVGTYLLVSGGNPTKLTVAPAALFWGIVTGIAAAAYVLLPEGLLDQYGSLAVSGWSMTIGGILFNFRQPIWRDAPRLDWRGQLAYWFIVILGSVVAYFVYLASLQYISATAVGLLDAFEPLAATAVSVLYLHLKFGLAEIIGTVLILSTVFILAVAKPRSLEEKNN
ncbi:peptide ABC transporter permease [Loigolactobacillus backii]|uniref:DMT family transporter n=1 Tax=Loigolactobacillus backii TaxID=375175 RepID=UPI000C1CB745|nr:EamA family transporter [Loigolactobacillus backii]PIO82692.1 peptide ABC transporter permease [Loigolactobacillus backii]